MRRADHPSREVLPAVVRRCVSRQKQTKRQNSWTGHRRQYGACALHAVYLRLQTHKLTISKNYCSATLTIVTRTTSMLRYMYIACFHSIVNTNTCTTLMLLIKIYLKFHKNTPTCFGHTTIIREVYRSSLKSLLSTTLCMFLC